MSLSFQVIDVNVVNADPIWMTALWTIVGSIIGVLVGVGITLLTYKRIMRSENIYRIKTEILVSLLSDVRKLRKICDYYLGLSKKYLLIDVLEKYGFEDCLERIDPVVGIQYPFFEKLDDIVLDLVVTGYRALSYGKQERKYYLEFLDRNENFKTCEFRHSLHAFYDDENYWTASNGDNNNWIEFMSTLWEAEHIITKQIIS